MIEAGNAPRVRRCYRRMVWRRQYDEIAAALLADAQRGGDERGAFATAATVRQQCDAVLREFAHEVDATRVVGLYRARSDAWRVQGDCAAALREQETAFAAYGRAHESYLHLEDRGAAGECLLLRGVAAANAGHRDVRNQIDAIGSGIDLLRDGPVRVHRYDLYRQVFDVVARHLWLADPDAAWRSCLWLLETPHLDVVADAAHHPIDIDTVITRLAGNCALLCDATRDNDGWSFRTAVVSAFAGITVHTARLRAEAARGVLDGAVASAYDLPLDDPVWLEIADAVLPPTMVEVLRRHTARQTDPVLLVVPDGPIASLPLAGMLLRDGSVLAEHVGVAFTPALTLLDAPDETLAELATVVVRRTESTGSHDGTELPARPVACLLAGALRVAWHVAWPANRPGTGDAVVSPTRRSSR